VTNPDFAALSWDVAAGGREPATGDAARRAWCEAAEERLGGGLDMLLWRTPEGIDVRTLYSADDLDVVAHLRFVPGRPPFVRGPYSTIVTPSASVELPSAGLVTVSATETSCPPATAVTLPFCRRGSTVGRRSPAVRVAVSLLLARSGSRTAKGTWIVAVLSKVSPVLTLLSTRTVTSQRRLWPAGMVCGPAGEMVGVFEPVQTSPKSTLGASD